MTLLAAVALSVLGVFLALRLHDLLDDRREWRRLAGLASEDGSFALSAVDGLPEPARRFFRFAILPGTPLRRVCAIRMTGTFDLGSRDAPRWRRMQARQLIAVPHGFVWRVRMAGGLPVSGSDSGTWTRFRLCGLLPVARQGGTPDHARAAYGRMIGEAVFWSPAALLPAPGVAWEAVDADTARVTVTKGALSQSVDLRVDPQGCPETVVFQRWSNANPGKEWRLQPFGGTLSDFREVSGYRLPFRVEAANMFGTGEEHPFFRAEVTEIAFPDPPD